MNNIPTSQLNVEKLHQFIERILPQGRSLRSADQDFLGPTLLNHAAGKQRLDTI